MTYFDYANTAYNIIKDPVGALVQFAGGKIGDMFEGAATGVMKSMGDLTK